MSRPVAHPAPIHVPPPTRPSARSFGGAFLCLGIVPMSVVNIMWGNAMIIQHCLGWAAASGAVGLCYSLGVRRTHCGILGRSSLAYGIVEWLVSVLERALADAALIPISPLASAWM